MIVPRGCTFQNCTRPHHARGLCHLHYKQALRTTPVDVPLAHEVPPCCVCDLPRPDDLGECGWCARPRRERLTAVRAAWRAYYRDRGWPVNVG